MKLISFLFSLFMASLLMECTDVINERNIVACKRDTSFVYETKDKFYKQFEFTSNRNYINDSTFIDNSILCTTDTANGCRLKFYISHSNWYLWTGNGWNLFYDNSLRKIHKVALDYRGDQIIPDTVLVSNNDSIFSFLCREPKTIFTTDDARYYFHPELGIVMISSVSTYFKRKGFDCYISDSIIKKR